MELDADLEKLLEECYKLHGHVCPGQLLGVRMALLGCRLARIKDPRGADRKNLIVWVEIDRCMADALSAVTGVRLGKRSLKYVDYGKVAATFVNTSSNEAFRIVALDESRQLADSRFPNIESRKERQLKAYAEATDDELFKVQEVEVNLEAADLPGRPISRVFCSRCGEGVNDNRQIEGDDGSVFCRPCSGDSYYVLTHCETSSPLSSDIRHH